MDFDNNIVNIIDIIKNKTGIILNKNDIVIKNNIIFIKSNSNIRFKIMLNLIELNILIKQIDKNFSIEL